MVHLRPWSEFDAPALYAIVQLDAASPNTELAAQFGGSLPTTLAETHVFITQNLSKNETRRNWAIVSSGEAVGNVGLSAIEYRHQTAWAHYWVAAAARGQGLATRALAAACDWAFAAGIFRIELGHRVNNSASCLVAERAGFLAEGIERQKLRYDAERFDVELHARLATDPVPDIDALRLEN